MHFMRDVDTPMCMGCFGGEKAWGGMWERDFWNQGKRIKTSESTEIDS